MATKSLITRATGFVLLLVAIDVFAATWLEQVTIPATLQYETNPNLSSNNYNAVWRFLSSPQIRISAVQDLDQWTAGVKLNIERSSDKVELKDRQDPSLNVGWLHEFERGEFGIDAKYAESSSRASELLDSGLVVQQDSTRTTKSIAAHWSRSLSEQMALLLSANYQTLQDSGSGQSGNTNQSINAKLDYFWSDRVTSFISAAYSRFIPDEGGGDTRHISAMAGVNWLATERFSYGVRWGLTNVSSGGVGNSGSGNTSTGGSSTDWQGGANINYTGERSDSSIEYSRSTGSSGSSSSISSETVNGRWSYSLTEMETVGATLSWRKNLGSDPTENRDIGAWYGRELSPSWSMRLNCRYREHETNTTTANDKMVGATLTYTTPNF